MLGNRNGHASTKLPHASDVQRAQSFDGAENRQHQIARVLEIRQFQDSFYMLVLGVTLLLTLSVLLSISNGGTDLHLVLGAAVFAGIIIGVRVWLRQIPDQHRKRMIFSYTFASVAAVFVDGPLFLTRIVNAPTLPAENMYCIGVVIAIWAFFSTSVGIALKPRVLERCCMLLGMASTPPTFSELGQPHQTVVTGAALLAGEIVAFVLNQRVWTQAFAQELSHAAQLSEIERKSFRVINHTSKRVMSNAALSCELIKQKLQPHLSSLGPGQGDILAVLDDLHAQAINGFNMCKSMLLQSAIQRGEYVPKLTDFELCSLWEELGANASARVTCSEGQERAAVRADKQLLLCILSNAMSNALTHGENDGPVGVRADFDSEKKQMRVCVSNKPGDNHSKLLALCGEGGDLLCKDRMDPVLRRSGCGQPWSTFLGLGEIRLFSQALGPQAQAHLRVSSSGVKFELIQLGVERPRGKKRKQSTIEPTLAETTKLLPVDLAFVCCDDDLIPRRLYHVLLKSANASKLDSVILGKSYDEVAGLADTVMEKARGLGPERVVCVIDENLDGYEEGSFKGSKIIAEFRRRGFLGLALIQSANDEPEAINNYIAAGSDGFIGKTAKGRKTKLEIISRLWHSKHGR